MYVGEPATGKPIEISQEAVAIIKHALQMLDWQPIETAPTQEMFIYYWHRDGKRAVGLAYMAVDGSWRDSEGNWRTQLRPTHWLPLPKAPT